MQSILPSPAYRDHSPEEGEKKGESKRKHEILSKHTSIDEVNTVGAYRLPSPPTLLEFFSTIPSRVEFIEGQGFTVEDFSERLRQAVERDPWCHEAVFAKIMTATADFDIFIQMMREAAEALPSKTPREEGAGGAATGRVEREEKGDYPPTRK